METTVRQLINRKGHTVWSTQPNRTVFEALELMAEKEIGALLVFEDDSVIGVISIGDVVKEIISEQEFVISQLENYITGGR